MSRSEIAHATSGVTDPKIDVVHISKEDYNDDTLIKGIKGVEEIFLHTGKQRVDGRDGQQKNVLKNILLWKPTGTTRTISSNVWEIYEEFGIEAARQYLLEEFGANTEDVKTERISLIADRMTYPGVISSISRYSMKKIIPVNWGKCLLRRHTRILFRTRLQTKKT